MLVADFPQVLTEADVELLTAALRRFIAENANGDLRPSELRRIERAGANRISGNGREAGNTVATLIA